MQLILNDTYLFFVFQWHLLQPERRVVCVGELKIASGNHAMILSFASFSLKHKSNLCSVELWKFQLQRVWPLPLSRLRGPPRGGRSVILVYQRLFAVQSAITRQSSCWMSMLKNNIHGYFDIASIYRLPFELDLIMYCAAFQTDYFE